MFPGGDSVADDPMPTVEHQAKYFAEMPDATRTMQAALSTQPPLTITDADLPTIPGYEISGEIARGGMGRVLAGTELALAREVAIKVLLPGAKAECFLTESKITARLPHPSIPPVYALGALADGSPYLAMKLVRGRTLATELHERPTALHDWPRLVQVYEQVCQAVGFAHAQQIIHRDLKPANIMLGAFGEATWRRTPTSTRCASGRNSCSG
jgi:serine/threonine protein kinase